MIRIGNGIDFHRLILSDSRPLILGGVEIESDLALEGHSDADILLHSICDAILGALALGDIGQYFPDSDPSISGLDSKKICAKTIELMRKEGYRILNMDSTFVGERPKISPISNRLRESVAGIFQLQLNQVSIKATTTEKMGAIGRKEGLAVFTTALLEEA